MSDFQELVKNFERIRDYMRQFFVYGFKVRSDYAEKSARTYDNERRRIESLLSGYTQAEYTSKGKKISINVDSKCIPENPLYAAWKSKSFTDKDIMLHFYLLELLSEAENGLSCSEAAELISLRYGMVFDNQTVRLKLKEYEELGLFQSMKEGREIHYHLSPLLPMETSKDNSLWKHLLQAITYYQGTAPFGIIGSTILDREQQQNTFFQFKHHYIVHTLEDGVLLKVLEAMREQREICFENKSKRSRLTTAMQGVPLKIFVSTQTGRRYLCLYLPQKRRFYNVRLDSMSSIKSMSPYPGYENLQKKLTRNLPHCFGVSFGGQQRMEELHLHLYLEEDSESFILDRLSREGRGGELLQIRANEYLYSGNFYDTNEMLSWVKTFTGRILDIQGSNCFCMQKVTNDWEKLYQMYCAEDKAEEKELPKRN